VSVSATQAARITQARSARTAKQPACQPACRGQLPRPPVAAARLC